VPPPLPSDWKGMPLAACTLVVSDFSKALCLGQEAYQEAGLFFQSSPFPFFQKQIWKSINILCFEVTMMTMVFITVQY
jgi:hypothetical protein